MSSELASARREMSLAELCEKCELSEVKVRAYVEEGVIDVEGEEVERWSFSEVCLVQIRRAHRLERDLGLNPAGAALALELAAEIDRLKQRLERFERSARQSE